MLKMADPLGTSLGGKVETAKETAGHNSERLAKGADDICEQELIAGTVVTHDRVHKTTHREDEAAEADEKAHVEPLHQQRQQRINQPNLSHA